MPEHHRHDQPQFSVRRDPGGSPSDPRPALLKPDLIMKELQAGQVGRTVPLLYRIYDAQNKGLITPNQGADFTGRLNTLVESETGDQLLERYPDPEQLKELFGQDYLGPEAIKKAWGVEIGAIDVPPQAFSDDERKRAAERGDVLVLRIEAASDGQPLTMEKIDDDLLATRRADRRLFRSVGKLREQAFYTQDVPRYGWALMSKEPLSGSASMTYWEQTALLIEELRAVIYRGHPLPEALHRAVKEYEESFSEFRQISNTSVREVPGFLTSLAINQLIRPSAVEQAYLIATDRLVNDRTLFPKCGGWTRSLASGGGIVVVGPFDDPFKEPIESWGYSHQLSELGGVISRDDRSNIPSSTPGVKYGMLD